MADKVLRRDSTTGLLTELAPGSVSAGAGDAGKLFVVDGTGRWDATLMPVGIVADVLVSTASGALTAGDLVYETAGGLIARASAAAAGNAAIGFVLASSAPGAAATMYLGNARNTAVAGLTVGSRYYLDAATAGAITLTPVSGTGKLHQFVGIAISATSLNFEYTEPILLA